MSRIVVCVERAEEDKRSCAPEEERVRSASARAPAVAKEISVDLCEEGSRKGGDRQKPRWRGQRRRRVNKDVNRREGRKFQAHLFLI